MNEMLARLSTLKEIVTCTPQKFGETETNFLYTLLDEALESDGLRVDSPRRHILFYVVERLLRARWQEADFRDVRFDRDEGLDDIRRIFIHRLRNDVVLRECNTWFGGVSNGPIEQETCRRNSIHYLVICLMFHAMHPNNGDEANRCVNALSAYFEHDLEALVEKLMDNDERFLFVLISLIRLTEYKYKPYQIAINPFKVFFLFLRKIRYDNEVIIDWLHSECVSIIVLLRILKTLGHLPKKELDKMFDFVDKSRPNLQRKSLLHGSDKDNAICFQIHEIHGEMSVNRNVSIFKSRNKLFERLDNEYCEMGPFKDNFHLFLTSLKTKLERYEEKELLLYNVKPMISLLSKVISDIFI